MTILIRTAALSAALALSGVASHAGGFAQPRIEPEVMAPEQVIAETAATSAPGGILVPLLLLALIAAVGLANGGGGGAPPVPPIGPA